MADSAGSVVLLTLALSMLGALAVVFGYNRVREGLARRGSVARKPSATDVGEDGRVERQASTAGEILQAIVHREMAADPELAGRSIDFGTAPDGTLEIWLGDEKYSAVEEIPDVRLRKLITRAAEEFNRGAPAS